MENAQSVNDKNMSTTVTVIKYDHSRINEFSKLINFMNTQLSIYNSDVHFVIKLSKNLFRIKMRSGESRFYYFQYMNKFNQLNIIHDLQNLSLLNIHNVEFEFLSNFKACEIARQIFNIKQESIYYIGSCQNETEVKLNSIKEITDLLSGRRPSNVLWSAKLMLEKPSTKELLEKEINDRKLKTAGLKQTLEREQARLDSLLIQLQNL